MFRQFLDGWILTVVVGAPEERHGVTLLRSNDIPNEKPASRTKLAELFSEKFSDGLFFVTVAPDFVKRAVAQRCINRVRFKNAVEKVAVKKVDIGAAEFTGALAFVKPAGELCGQVDAEQV